MSFLASALGNILPAGLSAAFGHNPGQGGYQAMSKLNPEQMQLMQQMLAGSRGEGGPYADIFAPYNTQGNIQSFNANIGDPARQSFQEDIIPQISAQFRKAGMGSSLAYQRQLSKQGANLEKSLAGLLMDYLLKGEEANVNRRGQSLMGILNRDSTEYGTTTPKGPSRFQNLIGGLTQNSMDANGVNQGSPLSRGLGSIFS